MSSIPELLNTYEQAVRHIQDGQAAFAIPMLQHIIADEGCPRELRDVAKRTLASVNQAPQEPPQPTPPQSPQSVAQSTTTPSADLPLDQVIYVDPHKIQPIPALDGLMPISDEQYARLKNGIAKRGIQVPLFVLAGPEMRLLAGYNRLRIAKELGLKSVPVIVKSLKPKEILEFAIRDNIERRQMGVKDIAKFISKLDLASAGRPEKGSKAKTVKDIADLLHVSPRTVERAKKYIRKVSEQPELAGRSVRSVLTNDDRAATVKSLTFEFIDGVNLTEDELSNKLAEVVDEIFAFDLHKGDKVKISVQMWHITPKS